MTELPSTNPKPLWQRLLPWFAGLMVLLCLFAICEPFVAQYRAIKAIEDKGGKVSLEAPEWMPDYVTDWVGEEQEYYIYEVIYVNVDFKKFSDADMRHLSRFTHLLWLVLNDTQVSDV